VSEPFAAQIDEPFDVSDLGERARMRSAVAGLCGWLLLAEPGPEIADQLGALPSLLPLGDPAAAVDYERIVLREVPPYESIFRSDDGQRGGPVSARVADSFDEIGFAEHLDGSWRVAGPDHLGLELRAHAHLISNEASAWENGRADHAAEAVESQRRLLSDHLATWSGVAIDALAEAADGSVYSVLFSALAEFLEREIEILRPAAILSAPMVAPGRDRPSSMGPGRLARHLLSCERSGIWLSRRSIAEAADRLGFPWRPMDGRSNLQSLISAARDADELSELLEPWVALAERSALIYAARIDAQPGAGVIWASWHERATSTARLLGGLAGDHLDDRADTEVVVRITGADPQRAIDLIEDAGYAVDHLE